MAHHNFNESVEGMINRCRNNNGRFVPRTRQLGSARPSPGRFHCRAAPYSVSQMESLNVWRRPVLTEEGAAGDEAKLCISNLESSVTSQDLLILFSELGELKDSSIHYDMEGKSLGAGEVIYTRHADAVEAMNRYNGVKLDGKPMIIEFVGVDIITNSRVPENSCNHLESPCNRYGERARASAKGRRCMYDNCGMRRTQEHKTHPVGKVTVEELDAELDSYWMSFTSSCRSELANNMTEH